MSTSNRGTRVFRSRWTEFTMVQSTRNVPIGSSTAIITDPLDEVPPPDREWRVDESRPALHPCAPGGLRDPRGGGRIRQPLRRENPRRLEGARHELLLGPGGGHHGRDHPRAQSAAQPVHRLAGRHGPRLRPALPVPHLRAESQLGHAVPQRGAGEGPRLGLPGGHRDGGPLPGRDLGRVRPAPGAPCDGKGINASSTSRRKAAPRTSPAPASPST